MLSEETIQVRWRNLFNNGGVTAATFQDARKLLDGLPLESPLRSRLSTELEEIRHIHQTREAKEQAQD